VKCKKCAKEFVADNVPVILQKNKRTESTGTMIIWQDNVDIEEHKETPSPDPKLTSNSPSIFSELSEEKHINEEVRMSRFDENI